MDTNNTSPEETIVSLQATIAAHEATIAEKQQAADDALAAHVAAQQELATTRADLTRALDDSTKKALDVAEATKVIEGQRTTLQGMTETLTTLQGVKPETPTVTVGGKTYAITAKSAQLTGENPRTVTVEDIQGDKELAAELVKKGVGFLELITPAKKAK